MTTNGHESRLVPALKENLDSIAQIGHKFELTPTFASIIGSKVRALCAVSETDVLLRKMSISVNRRSVLRAE